MPAFEFCSRGVDHRFEVPEVGGVAIDLGGDHDLLFGHDRLGVIALHVAAERLQAAAVRISDVAVPAGSVGGT